MFALSAGLMGTASKCAALGVAVGMGMRQSSPGQRPRLWGRVSQRAKAAETRTLIQFAVYCLVAGVICIIRFA